jgi:hypothetical protein
MRLRAVSSVALMGAAGWLAAGMATGTGAQTFPWQSKPNAGQGTPAVVKFEGPEQVEVTAKQPQEIELRFRVAAGYHINSHTPSEKSLIPTRLMVAETDGIDTKAVDFPPGAEYKPSFAPGETLSVYSGEFALKARVMAAPGSHLLQGGLRYQACDANACMPPKTIPVAVSVEAK